MEFRDFLLNEKALGGYHIIIPFSIKQKNEIDSLLEKFKSVNIAYPKSNKNSVSTIRERKRYIKEEFSKVNVEIVDTYLVVGAYLPEHDEELRRIFRIKDDSPIVIAVSKEEKQYKAMKERNHYFSVNKGEVPSKDKPVGLYGVS